MIEITANQIYGAFALYMWPFIRISALFITAPILSENQIPTRVKILAAAAITFLIAPTLPQLPTIAPFSWLALWVLLRELLIGLSLGWLLRIIITAVQATGEYIGMQMGLSFASFYSAETGGTTTVLSRWLNILIMLILLSANIHLLLIERIAHSFILLPIGNYPLSANAFLLITQFGSQIFIAGLLLAIPLITALLLINIAMAILNRAAPQFSIYTVGFPFTLLAGIVLLLILIPQQYGYFIHLFIIALQYSQSFMAIF